MKINIEIDCTPKEARTFLGFPDLEPLHEHMLGEFKDWMKQSAGLMNPEAMLKMWAPMGGQGFEQMTKFMSEAMKSTMSEATKGPGKTK